MTPQELKDKIKNSFPDGQVEVFDLTGTQDHYEVSVTSTKFLGLTRIQQHKMVMAAVDAELKSGEVHALSIQTHQKKQE